jgi:hypothetical protein
MAWTLHSKRTKRLLKQATEQAKTAVNELPALPSGDP